MIADNIHPALLERALKSDEDRQAELAAIKLSIEAANQFHEELEQALTMATHSLLEEYDGDTYEKQAVVPELSEDERHWIREAILQSQAVQDKVVRLCDGHLKGMPVRKAVLHKIRDTIYNGKHKLFRYIFDGKGAYRQNQSTVYNLCDLLDEEEYKNANHLFISLKRATVSGKQKIPN